MSRYFLFCICFLMMFTACQEGVEEQSQGVEVTAYPEINEVSQAIVANPNDASLYAQRAAMYYEVDGYDNAIVDLKKAISLDSTQVDYYHLLADSYLDYFRSRLALETMEKAAEQFPDNMLTLLKLSEFQMILTKNQESLKIIDQILKKNPFLRIIS